MIEGMPGKKIGMSRMFKDDGTSVAVTLISCPPCYVSDLREGSVQIAFEEVKEKSLNRPRLGYLKKRKLPPLKRMMEVKLDGKKDNMPEIGEKVSVDIFKPGDRVDVRGISKGKGFAGVMKRWNFSGGPKTHGTGFRRGPGAIGNASDPSRVFPGLKMAGRMGGESVTQLNLRIVAVDMDEGIVAVSGAVPGPAKATLFIKRSKRYLNES